jgi:hypothetical protein
VFEAQAHRVTVIGRSDVALLDAASLGTLFQNELEDVVGAAHLSQINHLAFANHIGGFDTIAER